LTTTAAFFLHRGYARVLRDEAPAAIKGTRTPGICEFMFVKVSKMTL
jgi:hypothetical protein